MAVTLAMKITNAIVAMQSQHAATMRHEERESLRTWVGRERPDFEGIAGGRPPVNVPAAPPQISEAGKAAQAAEKTAIEEATEAAERDPFLKLVRLMVEMLTGRPVKVFSAEAVEPGAESIEMPKTAERAGPGRPGPEPAGFGIEYDYHAIHEESEQTTFSAQGVIRTTDGREISFNLNLSMSRQFRQEVDFSLRAGDARRKDPLVINFDGSAVQLSDQRFRFDLDADGHAEEVPLLKGGSGYLALDINGNGKIDSGAELFGPSSGSGFAELARHDEDGNGWIDESDTVFDRLRIWTPMAQATEPLATLQQRGVGALYLTNLATPFELRGSGNSDLGAVKATSLYLAETGTTGTLQEIDLTV